MLRKFLAAATVLLLAFGLTSVVGTAASAHAGNMTVGVVCNTTTGKYDVTYTLHWTQAPSGGGTGHYRLGESSFINNWSYPGGKTWTDFSINSGTGSKSWTQSLPGNTVGNGPWTYAYIVWADGYNQQKVFDTRVEGLKGDCTTPKPDPVTGKETRTTEVCTSPADGTLTVKKYSKDWTQVYKWVGGAWVLQDKVYSTEVLVSTTYKDSDDCRPTKPDPKAGTDSWPSTHDCADLRNGTAVDKTWARDWTQSYSWSTSTHTWVLGDKVYGQPYVVTSTTVDDDNCIPEKPEGLKGTDPLPPTHFCVDPKNGTATDTYYAKDWTQTYTWSSASHTWVLGAKVYGDSYVTKTEVVDDESCIPDKPEGKRGTDPQPPSHVCVEPGNGTATDTFYAKDWTQTYSWDNATHTWVLGDKVYGDTYVTKTEVVDAEECIPDKPKDLNGTDPLPPTHVCVEPADGTATETSYAKDWTQTSSWDNTTHTWVLGEKVYGETYITGTSVIEAQDCTPPTLDGTLVASQCVDDVPWIEYDVNVNDPYGLSTDDGTATFTFTAPGSDETYVKTVAIGNGKFLWPGATATDNGDGTWTATGWPGWALVDDEWVTTGDDNFGWTRNGVNVHIEVNPEMDVTLSYPPPTALCVAGPPTEVHGELDAPPADAVEAEAQYAG